MSTAVHHPDTPVSSGSPASPSDKNVSVKDDLDKEKSQNMVQLEDAASSPHSEGSCRSGSSSPSSAVIPNLKFMPSNGILTPPNDTDTNESIKNDKSAGRLKFYKDGILCLELSHQDEGEKRKWVQVRAKTVFPTIIHTKREVTIPVHVSPTSGFASPLPGTTNSTLYGIGSSASHTSDDGSSMLSSPRIRESNWKKPVPQKFNSGYLDFFMRPGVCLKGLRHRQSYFSVNARRPFGSLELQEDHNLRCNCDIFPGNTDSIDDADGETNDKTSDDKPYKVKCNKRNETLAKSSKATRSIVMVIQKLNAIVETRLKTACTARNRVRERGVPKKRSFKDSEFSSPSPVRPAKFSPNKSKVKTILNIPGFGDIKANNSDVSGRNAAFGSASEFCNNDGRNRNEERDGDRMASNRKKKDSKMQNKNASPNQSASYLASLPAEHQQLFQQQTMSKAISYTITSLLSPRPPNSHSIQQQKHAPTNSPPNKFPGRPEKDQKSFLRHLLDTSDPIPKATTATTTKQEISQNMDLKTTTAPSSSKSLKPQMPSSSSNESSGETRKKQSPPIMTPIPTTMPQVPLGFLSPPYLPPGMFGGGSPFPLPPQAYEALFGATGGQNQSMNMNALMNAAAAAELQHYQTILSQFHPSVAAAMAASYFQPQVSTGSAPVPTTSSGRRVKSENSQYSHQQREREVSKSSDFQGPNGTKRKDAPSIPVPFHAPRSDNPNPRETRPRSSGSTSGHHYSRGERLDSCNQTDEEMPLNLSKKR